MVPIQEWINARLDADKELVEDGRPYAWKRAVEQAIFARDTLARCVAQTYEQWKTCASVIAEHTSKSVKLPVVLIERPGLSVLFRYNFHYAAIGVRRNTSNGFLFDNALAPLICEGLETQVRGSIEGFPADWHQAAFTENKACFTVLVPNLWDAHAFIRMIGIDTP